MFKYNEKNIIHLQYSECSPLQKLQQSSKMLTLVVFRNQMNLFTYGLYIHAVLV